MTWNTELRNLTALCALLLTGMTHAATGTRLDQAMEQQIEKIVLQELSATGTPSASIAIVIDGQIVSTKAYGLASLKPKVAARPDMRYEIASISKEFLGTALVMLEADGRLSLDDKVSRYIPDAGPAADATIRQLLSHTAGIRDYWPQDYVFEDMLKPISHDALLNRWAKQPLDFEIGSKWQYSNTGYVLAGVIFEKVSGEALFDFLQRRIFTPLQMTSVINVDTGAIGSNDAIGYTSKGLSALEVAPTIGRGWLFAAGELAMTAEDLARWDVSLIRQTLLSKAGYQALERDTLLNNGAAAHYGLGLRVSTKNERRILAHNGGASGYVTSNVIYPDNQIAIVVLTNTDAGYAAGSISDRLQNLILNQVSPQEEQRKAEAHQLFADFARRRIDRTLFSPNFNVFFTEAALKETAKALTLAGPVKKFTQKSSSTRGGMDTRVYEVETAKKTFTVVTRTLDNNLIEQYTFAPQ